MRPFLSIFSFSSLAFAQEAKKEEKQALKSVSCDPTCGFMVRSHDEAELSGIVKEHAKKVHNMDMSDAQIKGMMKTEKMAKKKAEKMDKKM